MDAKTALVADDEEVAREILSSYLELLGYQVVTASDGERALAMLGAHDVALVLLDILMPRMTGWEVLESMRSAGNTVPVVVVTGHCGEEARARVAAMGAELLTKPLNLQQLEAAIGRAMEGETQASRLSLAVPAGRLGQPDISRNGTSLGRESCHG